MPAADEESTPPADLAAALRWVFKASEPLASLAEPATARRVLDGLKLKLDGKPAAAETVKRKRRVLTNAVRYAVELGELQEDPLAAVTWTASKVVKEVDPAVVVNPVQVRELLAAVFPRRRLPAGAGASPGGLLRLPVLRRTAPGRSGGAAAC